MKWTISTYSLFLANGAESTHYRNESRWNPIQRLSIFQIKFNEVHRICLSYGKQSANFDIDEPWGSLPNAIEVEKLSKSQDRNVSEKERTKENPVKSTAKFRKNNRLKENKPSEAECLPTFTVPVHCNASTKIKIDPVEEKKGKIGLSTDMFPHSKKDEVKEEEEWEKKQQQRKEETEWSQRNGKKRRQQQDGGGGGDLLHPFRPSARHHRRRPFRGHLFFLDPRHWFVCVTRGGEWGEREREREMQRRSSETTYKSISFTQNRQVRGKENPSKRIAFIKITTDYIIKNEMLEYLRRGGGRNTYRWLVSI